VHPNERGGSPVFGGDQKKGVPAMTHSGDYKEVPFTREERREPITCPVRGKPLAAYQRKGGGGGEGCTGEYEF